MSPNQTSSSDPKRRRGIYLLPNLFTTAALFSGFYAIVASMQGRFESAAIAIFIAMILDTLDGRVARLTHTESAFGAEYDSLADMVSFGLAPALVMYEWSLGSMGEIGKFQGQLGWLAAFAYAACAALRLARFNTQIGSTDKRYFQGLPSPSAAAIVIGLVWVGDSWGIAGEDIVWLTFVITVFAGSLMVSNVLFYSFKQIDLRGRVPFVALLAIVSALVFAALDPPTILFLGFFSYALSGPVISIMHRRQRLRRRWNSVVGGDSKPVDTDINQDTQ